MSGLPEQHPTSGHRAATEPLCDTRDQNLCSRGRCRLFVMVLSIAAILVSGCSDPEVLAVEPTLSEMVSSYEELGLTPSVADCVVGLSERRDLVRLNPTETDDPATQLMIEEFIASCVTADALVNATEEPPERLALSDEPFTYGDNDELDELWADCESGDGSACDRLWEIAPVGSNYEEFGVTCGHRPELLNCSEELWPEVDPDAQLEDDQLAG